MAGKQPAGRRPTARAASIDEVLHHAAVFRHLAEEDRRRLIDAGSTVVCGKVDELRAPPSDAETICVLLRGGVRLDPLLPEGSDFTLSLRRRRSDLFVLVNAPADDPAGEVIARALSDRTEVFVVSMQLVLEAALSNPAALEELVALLRQRDRDELKAIGELVCYAVRARLAHKVAELAEAEPDHIIRLSRTELAALVGTSEAEVTRELHQLRKEGLVAFRDHQPRRIVALDLERLAHYGKGGKTKSR